MKDRKLVTQANIDKWATEVRQYIDSNDLQRVIKDPNHIFNCDKTAFFLASSPGFVLAPRSEIRVFSVTGNSDKENHTVLVGANANGLLMPPMVMYKYERLPSKIYENSPNGWGIGKTETGWINCGCFYEYITNIFHPWLLQSKIKLPVILFLDGHVSHLSLELSNFCVEHGIHIIALFPHASHILQPMDVAVFAFLKSTWKIVVSDYKFEESLIEIPIEKFAGLVKKGLDRITASSIQKGFQRCGLFPFSPVNLKEVSVREPKTSNETRKS